MTNFLLEPRRANIHSFMRKQILLLFITISFAWGYSQDVSFEFYTSYGYTTDSQGNLLSKLDGKQYYWYVTWNLDNSISQKELNKDEAGFYATGIVTKIDLRNNSKTKFQIKKIIFGPDPVTGEMKSFIYPENNGVNYLMLIRGEQKKYHYINICHKDEIGSCKKRSVHASYSFNDDVYRSKVPSQIID